MRMYPTCVNTTTNLGIATKTANHHRTLLNNQNVSKRILLQCDVHAALGEFEGVRWIWGNL